MGSDPLLTVIDAKSADVFASTLAMNGSDPIRSTLCQPAVQHGDGSVDRSDPGCVKLKEQVNSRINLSDSLSFFFPVSQEREDRKKEAEK